MKKLVALILALTLMLCLLVNTTVFAAESEIVELNMVYPSDPGAEDKLNTLMAEFNKTYPNIKVTYTFIPFSSWSDYILKVKTLIASGNSPDILRLAVEGINLFVAEGLALPFDDFINNNPELMDELGVSDIHPKLNAAFTVNGSIYGLAWEWNDVVMHINTARLEEAGLGMPSEDWDTETFLQYAQALTDVKDGQKRYGFYTTLDYFTVNSWLVHNDASLLNEDMTVCTLDDPKAIKTIQFLYDLIYEYEVAPAPSGGVDSSALFINGQVAMLGAGRWPIIGYQNADFHDYDVQYMPAMSTQKSSFGAATFPVLSTTRHPNEALLLAAWLSASEFSQYNFLKYDSIPSRISVMENMLVGTEPANGMIFRKSAEDAVSIQTPAKYVEIMAIYDRYMSEIFANEISVEDGLKAATLEINDVLKK